MHRDPDGLPPLHFHYLSLLKREYESLVRTAEQHARDAGFRFRAEPHGYDVLTNLERVKDFLALENTLVEVPLHTAARLVQDPVAGADYKAVASPYTFTAESEKIVLYYYGENAWSMSELLCTAHDSIATRLFRDYAMRKGWNLDRIDENTLEKWDYESVYRHANYDNALIPDARLANSAFLISGTAMIEKMDKLVARRDAPRKLKLRRHDDDIYSGVKGGWRETLGALHRELPDLPGTMVVARTQHGQAPFLRPLIDAISEWNLDAQALRAAAMGSPHVGTPISVVATVVYMELMAKEAFRHRAERLPTLDYGNFYLSDSTMHWDAERERAQAVRAVELGAEWLFKSRLDYVSETLDLPAYCATRPDGGPSPAHALATFDEKHLVPLARQLEELRAIAHGDGAAADKLREKVDLVFKAQAEAKRAFRAIDPGTRTARSLREDSFHNFALPSPGAPIRVRIWKESWRPDPDYRRIINQLINEAGAERLKPLLTIASFICQQRKVLNDVIKERLALALDERQLAQSLFHVRLLFPFIVPARPASQSFSSERAKQVVHPGDLSALEAMKALASTGPG